MPARNSARPSRVSLAHPFSCPTGDGGQCALPRPPIQVVDGKLRIMGGDAAGEAGLTVDAAALRPLHGTGREALVRVLDHPGTSTDEVADGLLVSCTCGHLYLAKP